MQVGNIPQFSAAERRSQSAARRISLNQAIADTAIEARARRQVRAEVDRIVGTAPPPRRFVSMSRKEAKAAWDEKMRGLRRHSLEAAAISASRR